MELTHEAFEEAMENFQHHDDYGGYGYIGERERFVQRMLTPEVDSDDPDTMMERLMEADRMIMDTMQQNAWDMEILFQFANSKHGRHFADDMLHARGQHGQRILEKFQEDPRSTVWKVSTM